MHAYDGKSRGEEVNCTSAVELHAYAMALLDFLLWEVQKLHVNENEERIQKIQNEGAECDPPSMEKFTFRICSIQHCGSICNAKLTFRKRELKRIL